MRKAITITVTTLVLACLLGSAGAGDLPTVQRFSLADVSGAKHTADDWKGKKAVVLFFLNTDCPVSNFYCPDYARLAKTFGEKGVAFYGIHPDPDVTAKDAARHANEYRLKFPVLLDPTQAVTGQTRIKVVPEAVVMSAKGRILYRGRIDDRYNPQGVRREIPMNRDLEDALTAVLAGKQPRVTQTTAYGCPLPEPAKQQP